MRNFSFIVGFVLTLLLGHSVVNGPALADEPILQCTETCQQFAFNGSCSYRTRCDISAECMTLTTCAQFDSRGRCLDERVQKLCALPVCPGYPVPAPSFPISCDSECQKRDSFGKCVYFSRCEIQGRCMHQTECERFDTFDKKCISEKTQHTCY